MCCLISGHSKKTNTMKNIFLTCLFLSIVWQIQAQYTTPLTRHFRVEGFVQNQGQVTDQQGKFNNRVKFLYGEGDFHLVLSSAGFSYELLREIPDVQDFPESGFTDPD